MQINYKYFLLSILLSIWTTAGWAQTPKPSFILDTQETGTRNYVARDYISLKTNFIYTASPGKSFIAKIDPNLPFTIISVPNPVPGDVSGAANDKSYTPGGTYGSDPVRQVQSLPSVMFKSSRDINGNIVSSMDTSYVYPVLWFKTVPLTNNLNGNYTWKDVTGNDAIVQKYSSQGAGHGEEYKLARDKLRTYNFNPAIDLSYENVSKEILVKNSNLAQATVIGVWGAKESFDKDKFMFAINGRRKESVLFCKRYVVEADSTKTNLSYGDNTTRNFLYRTSDIEGTDSSKFHERSLRVGTYYKANKPNASVWGEAQKAVISLGNKFDSTNVNNTSRFKSEWQNFDGFKGFTPELLVFNRQLSPGDCNKFETYLAIKYGLTLDKSYVAANGTTLWDYAADTAYNHRIAGYGREDALGLYQKMATSTYEEAPFYSEQSANDSYDQNDSYNLSSRNRLLVMGCQQANTMDNGKYILFGDNTDSLKITSGSISGFATLNRKWLVNTNIYQSTGTDKELNWQNAGLTITDKTDFKSDILKSGSQSTVSAITTETLKGTDGYFAWTVEQEYGPVTVKFGNNQAELIQNSHDYGYSIDSVGQVFPVQKGIVGNNGLFSVEKGQRIEVEKNGGLMSLRVNGIRNKNTEFAIDSADIHKIYYGSVSLGKNPFDIKLTDFRHGGFVDTGNKLELSYLRTPGFTSYKNGQTYLIVDRSGTGSFPADRIESFACEETDLNRLKIIFNNIFWDTDGNGRDAFTFGYQVSTPNEVKKKDDPEPMSDLRIYYSDPREMTRVTVKIQTAKPMPTIVMVYDISGRCVYRKDLPESKDVQYMDIKLPDSGIYIIRVLNNETRYSQKVISKK